MKNVTTRCFVVLCSYFASLLFVSTVHADELNEFEEITMQVISLDGDLSQSVSHMITLPGSLAPQHASNTESLLQKQGSRPGEPLSPTINQTLPQNAAIISNPSPGKLNHVK